MNKALNNSKKVLKKYNQEHIIPLLEDGKNTKLMEQVLNTNFEELKNLYNKTKEKNQIKIKDLKPIKALNPNKLSNEEIERIKKIGEDIIINNKFAVSTMARRTRNKTWT